MSQAAGRTTFVRRTAPIPLSEFFGLPDHASPSVSPCGRLLGWMAPLDGAIHVWVRPLDGSAPARAITRELPHSVHLYTFCQDDRQLLVVQDGRGDEQWHLTLVDHTTGWCRPVRTRPGVQARVLGYGRLDRGGMLLGLNEDDPARHDAYRLDLASGECTLVQRNPGWASWLVGTGLDVRGGIRVLDDGTLQAELGRDGVFVPYLTVNPLQAGATFVHGFNRDDSALFVVSSLHTDTARLERHDLDTGQVSVLFHDPEYDVESVWQHPETLEVQAVTVLADQRRITVLDPCLEPHVAALRAQVPGQVTVSRRERTDRWWMVSGAPPDGPTGYHLYDAENRRAIRIFSHRTALARRQLAPKRPFTTTSRDGLRLHGYVTLPRNAEEGPCPAVLLVHGGPWARDGQRFEAVPGWLADRGYACVQVNFRGSTGYGNAFVTAGDGQWGAAMQDDLLDALDHLVEQGLVNADRVAVMGASYGGYAALTGATRDGDTFRCAIAIAAPSNLLTWLQSVPRYWSPLLAVFHQRVGHPEHDRERLVDRSPLTHVSRVRMPVLLAQGGNDPRVPVAEAEQMVEALRCAGIQHEYLLFPDEGHGVTDPGNRMRLYSTVEAFLDQHLGAQPPRSGHLDSPPYRVDGDVEA
ncbi:MAG TPA: prolyl oligopeptidase family serine peptidase [Kineosporiaceae bacterium]